MTRIAVLASGGGSNLQAILDYAAQRVNGVIDVVLVASDQPHARALDRARDAGIPAIALHGKKHPDGIPLAGALEEHRADIIALAGYLRLVPEEIVRAYRDRIVNIHPALLPAFGGRGMYGHRVHEAVIASAAKVSGATVHLVDEEFDRGRILAQWPVAVQPDDDAERLAARVLRVEHLLYPRVLEAFASGAFVHADAVKAPPNAAAIDEAHVGAAIDRMLKEITSNV